MQVFTWLVFVCHIKSSLCVFLGLLFVGGWSISKPQTLCKSSTLPSNLSDSSTDHGGFPGTSSSPQHAGVRGSTFTRPVDLAGKSKGDANVMFSET
jgi:hypothetical protein